MRQIFSFIFERITNPLGLPVDPFTEWIILTIIGIIAYILAYRYVGNKFENGSISSSLGGSVIHWIFRLFFFLIVWVIAYLAIWLFKLLIAYWMIIVFAVGGLLLSIAFGFFIHKMKKKSRTNIENSL